MRFASLDALSPSGDPTACSGATIRYAGRMRVMRKTRSGRDLIGISCLLVFVVAATAAYAEMSSP